MRTRQPEIAFAFSLFWLPLEMRIKTRFILSTSKERGKCRPYYWYSYLFCSSSLATSSSTDFVRDFDREGGLRPKVSGLLFSTESSLILLAIMRIKDVYLINRERCHEVKIKGRNDDSGRSSWFSGGKSETPSFHRCWFSQPVTSLEIYKLSPMDFLRGGKCNHRDQ